MKKIFIAFCCIISTVVFAQQGKNGSATITTTVEVNEYTYLTANEAAGATTITVASSTLNSHSRFSGNLAAGDLIMIIQLQGATLNGSINPGNRDIGQPKDSTWGAINNYNNCGNYEFAEVSAVPSGTTITLDCPLQYSYTDTGKVEIVRVPRYASLTINSGGTISCDPWDSTIGGIIAIEVQGNTIINSGGAINATGMGFRGGQYNGEDSIGWGVGDVAEGLQAYGKEKGEGVGGYEWKYKKLGGKEGMGAPGNGGGGGDAQNGGGGGGANGGVVANYINGYGNPDISTNNNKTAWGIEYTWLPTFTSAGGGRGGYTFGQNNVSPLTNAPGAGAWAGDDRRSVGGRGGRPLNYSTGKIFIAGGGGAGDQNDGFGGTGASGGGIVYLMSYGTVSGAGQIISNGNNGANTHGTAAFGHAAGIDGAGGGGGGGTLIVNSVGNISGISLTANGGTGGNQVITWNFSSDAESEGPGGGGGGGYIATSNAGLTETTTGGANGTSNAIPLANFPPNGATIGGVGTTNASIANFYITAKNDTICSGQSATLTATLNGTVPNGTTIEWFSTSTGGSSIGTGPSYTTPALTVNTTYYVGTCPGTYRIAVNVIISGSASVSISPNKTICKGTADSLKATGGTAYSWTPTTGLSNANIANPIATPIATTTYTVNITTACGLIKDSVKITVSPLPTATISASTNPICAGKSTTLTAGGGTVYTWSNGATTSSITVTPLTTTTYTAEVSNGTCTKDTTLKVTVNPLPTPTIGATSNPICPGSSTTISVTGGTSYTWSNSATTTSITVSPATTTNYSVIVSNGTCTKDTNITVTVSASPTVTVNPSAPTICSNGSVTLNGVGATTYTWSPNTSLTCTNCVSTVATPTATTTYTVIGANAQGCTDTNTVTVTVGGAINARITGNDSLCSGNSATLTASGGTTYTWSNGATTSIITVIPLVTTTYTATISNGICTKDTTFKITVTPTPTASIAASVNPICAGESSTLTVSGGTAYKWNTGATTSTLTVNPISTTTYTATVSNGKCSKDTTITVTVNTKPTVTLNNPAPSICTGGNVAFVASGASSYTWAPNTNLTCNNCPNPTASPTATTTYTIIGTNLAGCKDTITVTVTVVNTLTATISPPSDSVCNGSSTTLTAGGGSTYLWSNSATTAIINVSPNVNTTYSVLVSSGGCKDSATITVKVNPLPVVVISNDTSVCSGTNVTLNVSGGGTYLWSNSATTSSITVNPANTTTYTAQVTSSKGCLKDTVVTVTINPAPTLTITPTMISCAGTPDTLSVLGGNGYLWSNGSTNSTIIVSPITSKIYTVTTGGGGPCPVSAVDTVKVKALPTVTTQGTTSVCNGDSAVILATGGGTYSWAPGGKTTAEIIVYPSSTTIYTVSVTKNGCTKMDTFQVALNPSPNPTVNPSIITLCKGESTMLSATGGTTYLWSPSATLSDSVIYNPIATPSANTTYVVTVANTDGCTAKDSIKVFVIAGASGSACCDATIVPGASETLSVSGANAGSTYKWTPSGSLSCDTCANPIATPSTTTWYYVTISDANGCSRLDSLLITVNESGCGAVFIPTAFSPGQMANNILYVRGDCIASMEFDIFDRWGNKVFTSTNIKDGWDGSYRGQGMNLGTYVYFLKATLIDGTTINQKGNVTLVR